MSQTRRVLLHALMSGGVAAVGFVFSLMSIAGASRAPSIAATLASAAVAIGFAVKAVAILRAPHDTPAESTGSASSGNWKLWGLAAWAVICLAAAASEFFGGPPKSSPSYSSPLSTLMLVGLIAWQAVRTVKSEQGLQRS